MSQRPSTTELWADTKLRVRSASPSMEVALSEPVLVLEGVWKGFDRGGRVLSVFEDVSLAVGAREIVSVVGTRDQGKTTLLKLAAGIETPDRGSVRVTGRDVTRLSDKQLSDLLREDVGLAARSGPGTQETMWHYVGMPMAAGQKRRWQARRQRIAEVLERLDVADCAQLSWDELSNWQRVRVELASAIVNKPRLLLIDDVLDGLGLGKTDEAMRLIHDLAQETGAGVLMVASDFMAADPSDVIFEIREKKLRLRADNRVDNIRPIDCKRRPNEACS
jgi:ABC-type lipoprotein export system ATPase subunit